MTRFYIIYFLIFGLIFSALILRDGKLISLVFPLIFYLIFGLINQPGITDLEITRITSPMRVVGNIPVEISVAIKNRGNKLDEIFLEDSIPDSLTLTGGANHFLGPIDHLGEQFIKYQVTGSRGVHQFVSVKGLQFDPFGLIRQQKIFSIPCEILILPEIPRMKSIKTKPRATRIFGGNNPSRKGGVGIDFYGVRTYSPGDPMRLINWKASARTSELMFTNEFERERAADIWIILDARTQTNVITPNGALFEKLVLLAGALSNQFLEGGNRVGLLSFGSFLRWAFLGYGKIQQERILHALARVQPGSSLVPDQLKHPPMFQMSGKSLLILISTLNNTDVSFILRLRSRGFQVFCISPNPILYERENIGRSQAEELGLRISQVERRILIAQLRQAGVIVEDWDTNIPMEKITVSLSHRFKFNNYRIGTR